MYPSISRRIALEVLKSALTTFFFVFSLLFVSLYSCVIYHMIRLVILYFLLLFSLFYYLFIYFLVCNINDEKSFLMNSLDEDVLLNLCFFRLVSPSSFFSLSLYLDKRDGVYVVIVIIFSSFFLILLLLVYCVWYFYEGEENKQVEFIYRY